MQSYINYSLICIEVISKLVNKTQKRVFTSPGLLASSPNFGAHGIYGGCNWEVIKTGYGANKECGREGDNIQVGCIFWDIRHHGLFTRPLGVRYKLLGRRMLRTSGLSY